MPIKENIQYDIIDCLPDATFVINLQGEIIAWNKAMEKATGIPASEMIGKGNYEYAIPFHGKRQPVLVDFIFNSYPEYEKRYPLLIKNDDLSIIAESFCPEMGEDGMYFWSVAAPIYDNKGKLYGAIESFRDITSAKKMEIDLNEQKEYFEVLFRNSTDAVVMIDNKHRVVDINKKFEQLFGYTLDEIKGIDLDNVLDMGNKGKANKNLTHELLKGDPVKTKGVRYSKKGKAMNMSINGIPIVIKGQLKGAYAVYTDISRQIKVENAVRESREWFRAMVEDMPFLLCRLTPDMVVNFANDMFCLLHGRKRGGIIGEQLDDLGEADYYAAMKDSLQTLSAERQINSLDLYLKQKDGSHRWIRWTNRLLLDQGTHSGYLCIGNDITEKKTAEEALSKSEKKYRDILASIEEGYFEADLKGSITFFNESCRQMFGYNHEDFLAVNFEKLFKNPDLAYNVFKQVLSSRQANQGFITAMLHREGKEIFGEISVSVITDDEGQAIGFRGVVRDVTTRVRIQEQLRFLSLHDQLTGLYNRNYFEDELNRLEGSRFYPITIITTDLDGLKLINDTMGHDYGDKQ